MLKFRALFAYEGFLQNIAGPFYRRAGQNLLKIGSSMQVDMSSDDRFVQDLTLQTFKGITPILGTSTFVAPNSVLIGEVELDDNVSIWYGATLRGDLSKISVGRNSVVQDNCQVNGATIANNVFIGPNSTLGRCILGPDAFVAMGSCVGNGTTVNGVVAAGSVVNDNENVGRGEIWAGAPAKYLRDITPEELQILREHKQEISDLASIHAQENKKHFREILDDQDDNLRLDELTSEEAAYEYISKLNFPIDGDDEEFLEHRVFLKDQRGLDEMDEHATKSPDPYEQDLEHYPENFKLYQEDYEIYEKAKKFFADNPVGQAVPAQPERGIHPKNDKAWNRII